MPAKQTTSANEIHQIKITLLGSDPEIWRRVLVPRDFTLYSLHHVIQSAMGWDDGHLHEFRAAGLTYGPPSSRESPFDMPHNMDEGKVPLNQVLLRVRSKAVYTYDFGDDWQHNIVLEKQLPIDPSMTYPVCIGGEMACPPEDCGGIWGFYDMLEAIRNPKHKRHHDRLEWLGEDYDPQAFDIEQVNRKLQPEKVAAEMTRAALGHDGYSRSVRLFLQLRHDVGHELLGVDEAF